MSRPLIGTMMLASISATLAFATPVSARSAEALNAEVRYGDLDLRSETGVASLHRRIANAARQVCGKADMREIKLHQQVTTCRKTAIAEAAPKVELAIANARNGQELAATAALKVGKPVTR